MTDADRIATLERAVADLQHCMRESFGWAPPSDADFISGTALDVLDLKPGSRNLLRWLGIRSVEQLSRVLQGPLPTHMLPPDADAFRRAIDAWRAKEANP